MLDIFLLALSSVQNSLRAPALAGGASETPPRKAA